jgi:hypothetical protein
MTAYKMSMDEYTFWHILWRLLKTVSTLLSFTSSVLSSVGAWTFRTMIWHQRPLSIMYDILSLTNSTLLTNDTILLCTKNLYLIYDSRFPFHRKIFILPQVQYHCPPNRPPSLPLNLPYISTVPSKLSLGSPPYVNSLHSIIQISYPYSVTWIVYSKNPSGSKALLRFSNKFIFYSEGL